MTSRTKSNFVDLPAGSKNKEDVRGDDSVDEALCEMLGLDSFSFGYECAPESDKNDDLFRTCAKNSLTDPLQSLKRLIEVRADEAYLRQICDNYSLRKVYEKESVFVFPSELSIPPEVTRRLTDEVRRGSNVYLLFVSVITSSLDRHAPFHLFRLTSCCSLFFSLSFSLTYLTLARLGR